MVFFCFFLTEYQKFDIIILGGYFMLDILMSMVQQGTVSQGAAAGIHIFDLFDGADMQKKGGKRRFAANDDKGDQFESQLQGFDQAFAFDQSSVEVDPNADSEEYIEVENVSGGLDIKVTINDRFGVKSFMAQLDLDPNTNDLQLNISSQSNPYDSLRLTRQLYRMNHQLQAEAVTKDFDIPDRKGSTYFQDLVKNRDDEGGVGL